jgi:Sulfotransferase family
MAEQAPFFIVGAGRSGTTLLRLILTGHSRLHIPPETWFLRDLVRQFPLTGALTQPQRERVAAVMVGHERWPDLGVDADDVTRAVVAQAAGAGLREAIQLVYARLLEKSSKQRVGDKTPHYFEILPELATLFPDARFIYLVRDGRDVAMSWIDAGWQRYYEPGFEWPQAMACLRRDQRTYPDRVLEVRYEDLVRRAEDTVRRICDFLGEDFEPAMLDWRGRVDQVAARDRHLHGRLMQPLSDDAVAAWRRRLSAVECFGMEAWLHRALREGGYALRFDARGWTPAFRVVAGGLRVLAPVLRRGIPYLQRRGILPREVYF